MGVLCLPQAVKSTLINKIIKKSFVFIFRILYYFDMVKYIFLLTVLAYFSCFGNLKAQEEIKSEKFIIYSTPKPIPNAIYYDLQNRQQTLSAFHGKVLLINFWRPNCRLCLMELPSLDQLQKDYASNLQVLVIAEETDIKSIKEALYTRRLTNFSVFYDKNKKLLTAFGGQKVPRTILVDKTGKEIGYIQGLADFNALSLREQIDKLLSQ